MVEGESSGGVLRRNTKWIRDAANPVLAPGSAGSFDDAVCMNPWALVADGQYRLYDAGGATDGTKRNCLATAPVADPRAWTRHGPRFEISPARRFDARWCVLPQVVQVLRRKGSAA